MCFSGLEVPHLARDPGLDLPLPSPNETSQLTGPETSLLTGPGIGLVTSRKISHVIGHSIDHVTKQGSSGEISKCLIREIKI